MSFFCCRDRFWCAGLVACALLAAVALGGGRNYLIITAQDYAGSAPLNQFVAAKAAMGFNVSVYTVAPGTTREQIKAYIQSLWGTPDAPKYILIVGDTDGSSAGTNTIPHWTGGGSRHATTDLPYACMGGPDDWYPDIYIGRFSVRTVNSLAAVVEKTLLVESGNYPDPGYVKRAAFLATEDSTAQAEQTHNWVISTYMDPAEFESTRIYAAQGGGTTQITQAVNRGQLFVVYFGHSGSTGWSSPAFNQTNVRNLSNDGLYGLVVGWSCNTAHFDYDECFGETWLREPHKGAAAYLSASNYIWWGSVEAWESSRRMEKYFFTAIFGDGIREVRPAWDAALYKLLSDPDFGPNHDHTRNIFEEFVLLGDPALRLPEGIGFALDAPVAEQDVCCPPTTEVTYVIHVRQLGDFTAPVILSVEGLPPGASAEFSANELPPPYESVLTVSGLTGAMAGHYSIVVTGTSGSLHRALPLGLSIHGSPPAPVTLISPPDGATGVGLRPAFSWSVSEDAGVYDLTVARDPGFAQVVYTVSVSGSGYNLNVPLNPATIYYWRVQARNACGSSGASAIFRFTTIGMVMPTAYDMLNGETGTYTYFDDTYNGQGNNQQALAPLSGGLGDLTDGVIATQNWNSTPQPYVGWRSIDPTITFHFGYRTRIERIVLHLDDSNGSGGVYPPVDVTVTVDGVPRVFPVTDPPGGQPFAFSIDNLDYRCDTLQIQLADRNSSRYMMLSEVEFYGGPLYGDLNCDGQVNAFDVDGFVMALTDPLAYAATYPGCSILAGDCNQDGAVDAFDIDAFVDLLTGN
jgi:hypothetical protein